MTAPIGDMPPRSSGTTRPPTTPVQLAAAWALVGVPLAWGVWQVIQKSMALFR